MGRVGRDDEEQAVQLQQLMGLLTTDPALVWWGKVGQEQGEDHHMEKLGGQGVDGVVQLAQEGLHSIACKLKRLLKLKVEEVTLVNTLKIK